jgi:hypothetical protein
LEQSSIAEDGVQLHDNDLYNDLIRVFAQGGLRCFGTANAFLGNSRVCFAGGCAYDSFLRDRTTTNPYHSQLGG